MTVPDIGPSVCSATNYSFQVVNPKAKPFSLLHGGVETWFVDAHSTERFCFSAPLGTFVLNLGDSNDNPLHGTLTLNVT